MLLVYYNPSTVRVETRMITMLDIGSSEYERVSTWFRSAFCGDSIRIDDITILIRVV